MPIITLSIMFDSIQHFFVKKVYADHNETLRVRRTIDTLLALMPENFRGLNIGAGKTRLHPSIDNMEISAAEGIDLVGSVLDIPVSDACYDLVMSQEVLEHVEDPKTAVAEMFRVLKPGGGMLYLQIPFIIGYHPCPHDYWRFTHEGILELVKSAGFKVVDSGVTVGPATGYYRILVEFCAIIASILWYRLYKPCKLIAALFFYPLKWLDPFLIRSLECHRISGGYYVVCRKL